MTETLKEEKKRLLDRLLFLNVQSTGRDRIVERLAVIDMELNEAPTSDSKAC